MEVLQFVRVHFFQTTNNFLGKEFVDFRHQLDQIAARLSNSIRFTGPGKQMNHNNQNPMMPTIQFNYKSPIYRSRRVKRQGNSRYIAAMIVVFFVFLFFFLSTYAVSKSKNWDNPSGIAFSAGILGPLLLIVVIVTFNHIRQCWDACCPPFHLHHRQQQAQAEIELAAYESLVEVQATIPDDYECIICSVRVIVQWASCNRPTCNQFFLVFFK